MSFQRRVDHGPRLAPNLEFQPHVGPTPVFGFDVTKSVSSRKSSMPTPEYSPSGFGVVPSTAKVFVKDRLPPYAKTAGMVASAAMTGRKLAKSIQQAEDEGMPRAEAYVCKTVNVLAEEASGKVMKGAVVGGIPPYFALAASNPAVAATVPFVVPLIPDAYKGAQKAAHKIGGMAEKGCHESFEVARKLSRKEKK